jgi:hypothetical protein
MVAFEKSPQTIEAAGVLVVTSAACPAISLPFQIGTPPPVIFSRVRRSFRTPG